MNRWLMIKRLQGPAYILCFGFTALLNEFTPLHFGKTWPLYLIVAGVFKLAERAALAQDPPLPPPGYPGSSYPGAYPGYPGGYAGQGYPPQAPPPPAGSPPAGTTSSTAIVPSDPGHHSGEER